MIPRDWMPGLAVVTLAALAAATAAGAGTTAAPMTRLPAEPGDGAFDRYADPAMLGRAWAELDAGRLADCGLLLAEGERVLMRPRKGLSADAVLGVAVRVAAERGDKATLERLAKAAEAQGRKELAGRVQAAHKLAEASRALAVSVDVATTTPRALADYQSCLRAVLAARLTGDGPFLRAVEKSVRENVRDERFRDRLAESARTSPDAGDPAAVALGRLAGPARGPSEYFPPEFQGRTGEVRFRNDSRYPVTVTLWHPDNGRPYASYRVEGQSEPTLQAGDGPVIVGDNWGVQIGGSRVRALSEFSDWDGASQTFIASSAAFHSR